MKLLNKLLSFGGFANFFFTLGQGYDKIYIWNMTLSHGGEAAYPRRLPHRRKKCAPIRNDIARQPQATTQKTIIVRSFRRPFMSFDVYSYTKDELQKMPQRRDASHKGDYGRLLCICGSRGMCGAAYLSAKAAYRTGAGLVRILTVRENLVPLQTILPEAIVTVYDGEIPDRHTIAEALKWADATVIGCGLGKAAASRQVLSTALRLSDKPTLIDADGLNIISENSALKKYLCGKIITPHLLELSRLSGLSVSDIDKDREKAAYEFSKKHETVCVLKSHCTCVSDGSDKIYVNSSGNNGMATAGSGDVLSGIIGGILAQNKDLSLSMTEAAALGVYIHGLAGDIAAEAVGKYSLMASDIIDALPRVLK